MEGFNKAKKKSVKLSPLWQGSIRNTTFVYSIVQYRRVYHSIVKYSIAFTLRETVVYFGIVLSIVCVYIVFRE